MVCNQVQEARTAIGAGRLAEPDGQLRVCARHGFLKGGNFVNQPDEDGCGECMPAAAARDRDGCTAPAWTHESKTPGSRNCVRLNFLLSP